MNTEDRPKHHPTDEDVARAMRSLGSDIHGVMHMALINSNSLDELLEQQSARDQDGEIYNLVLPRMLIANQRWAANHVWEMAKQLLARFEAAYQGIELA